MPLVGRDRGGTVPNGCVTVSVFSSNEIYPTPASNFEKRGCDTLEGVSCQ